MSRPRRWPGPRAGWASSTPSRSARSSSIPAADTPTAPSTPPSRCTVACTAPGRTSTPSPSAATTSSWTPSAGGTRSRGASFTRCQFSLPYLVAVALADGRLGIPQLTSARRADPLVHALAGRVRATEDPALTAQYPERFPYEVEVMVRGSPGADWSCHAGCRKCTLLVYKLGLPHCPLIGGHMDFGLFVACHRFDESLSTSAVYEQALEMVELADQAGFRVAWFPEHHLIHYISCPS